jgi:hypothetical protein
MKPYNAKTKLYTLRLPIRQKSVVYSMYVCMYVRMYVYIYIYM